MQDKSLRNFNYPGLSIHNIINNPDEYIIPECIEACKKLWNMNIFTVSCSNRSEKKDENGIIKKYIMVRHLSSKNQQIFEQLALSKPINYRILTRQNIKYYIIVIISKDIVEDRDIEAIKLLNLTKPFKMQDCLEGYIPVKDYYIKNIRNYPYSTENYPISVSESEIVASVKKYLTAFGILYLLDLDRNVVYENQFYKDAHQKYLKELKKSKNLERL